MFFLIKIKKRKKMKGKILDYNIQESKGVISGDDGQRYSFENKGDIK